jgi:large subunit ribosomal protein L17
MRHGKKNNHLSRPASHRKALLANQAKSLILHKRIMTTVAKAKALRKFIEPIITKSKVDSTHARRVIFSYFQDKEPVKILFNEIVHKVGDRPGGYTRIIKTGTRLGDNSEMCMMELVDYNELLQKETNPKKVRTRRGRSKAKAVESTDQEITTQQKTASNSKNVEVKESERISDKKTSSAGQNSDADTVAESVEA